MGMKLKSGADLCGFQLTNFCVQGEASAPSDAALGRKYFHTNATDDVATGISLLNRERIYLGEGAWRATAYLDDIAAINEKLNLITGDTDTDTLINNLKDLEEFLKDFSETDKLKSLLDGKLSTSGGTIEGDIGALSIKRNLANMSAISFENTNGLMGYLGFYRADQPAVRMSDNTTTHILIHSGNIGDYALKRVDQVGDLNSVSAGEFFFSKYQAANRPSTNFSGGLTLQVLKNSTEDQRIQLAFGTDYVGYVRGYANGTYTAWKTIAFTDSDITGYSAGLKHSNGTVGAVVNSSGNVTIGASDLAETSAKLYVDGNTQISSNSTRDFNDILSLYNPSMTSGLTQNINLGYNTAGKNYAWLGFYFDGLGSSKNAVRLGISGGSDVLTVNGFGNVLIGTATDSGYKLDVNGSVAFGTTSGCDVWLRRKNGVSYINAASEFALTVNNNSENVAMYVMVDKSVRFDGNVRVTGNLIVDGEVSAGGAGAEGGTSGSGSAEGVSEIFTPTSTSMAFDHNLGEDVIVQVYEKNGNVWNMVMVDTEITSATRVTLRFGKTETTQHKVVIMGV